MRGVRELIGTGGLVIAALLVTSCGSSAQQVEGGNVRAVLSSEDASDILPGSSGDFVVMIHLESDGTVTPLVMLTPRTAVTYASYLVTDDSVYLMEVPTGAAWPLVGSSLSWDTAIISSESQLTPNLLDQAASQLAVAATVREARVDSSIIEWTQQNVSHMAGAYVIVGAECLPAVVRQAGADEWLITAIPGWNGSEDLASLVSGASSVSISDSTRVNPSRIPSCAPGR